MRLPSYVCICVIAIFLSLSCSRREPGAKEHKVIRIETPDDLRSARDSLAKHPDDRRLLSAVCGYYTRMRMFDSVVAVASPSIPLLERSENEYDVMYPIAYVAQAYLFLDNYDSSGYYIDLLKDRLPALGRDDSDKFIAGMVYNILAISSMKTDMDYTSALDYFKKAFDVAWSQKDTANSVILLSNISSLYHFREDTTGLQYVKRACELEKKLNVNIGIRATHLSYMASMFQLCGNMDSAMFYASKAVKMSQGREGYYSSKALVYRTYGDVLSASGKNDEAEKAYMTAEDYLIYANESTAIQLYLSLGNFFLDTKKLDDSEKYYRKGLEIAERIDNAEYTHKVLLGLAKACVRQGKKDDAYYFFQKYYEVSSSVFSLQREQEFSRQLLKYEELKYNEELNEKELVIAKEKLRRTIILFVSVIIMMLAAYAFLLYSKSKKMYAGLYDQYSNYRKKLDELGNIAQAKKENESKSLGVLFERLEQMMKDGLFRRKDLSLASVSEMLDSNSSYVSKAINTCAGTNFIAYVNSYRINDAMKVLSDPDDDTPLKAVCDNAGYGNLTSFYRAFQKETGLSPSRFREEARRKTLS